MQAGLCEHQQNSAVNWAGIWLMFGIRMRSSHLCRRRRKRKRGRHLEAHTAVRYVRLPIAAPSAWPATYCTSTGRVNEKISMILSHELRVVDDMNNSEL